MEDNVDIWRYAILELHARNDDDVYLSLSPSDKQAVNDIQDKEVKIEF